MEKQVITIGVAKVPHANRNRMPVTVLVTGLGAVEKDDLFNLDGWNALVNDEPVIHRLETTETTFPLDLKFLGTLVNDKDDNSRRLASVLRTMEDNGEFHKLSGNRGLWLTKRHGLVQQQEGC